MTAIASFTGTAADQIASTSPGMTNGAVRTWLRLEGLAAFAAGLALYGSLGGIWLLVIPLLLLPDVSAAGYLVNPKLLVYGSGGYVSDEQRKAFSGTATEAGFYNHVNTDGYQLGGGAEYALTNRFYTGLGYRYSNYADNTARQRLFVSAGVRF